MRKLANERMFREVVARQAEKIIELGNEKILSVYSTLPKFETLAKCVPLKVTHRRIRKETEKFGRGEEGFLMKKGYEMGGVSL